MSPRATPGASRNGEIEAATGLPSRRISLIDTHAHLQGGEYAPDLADVLERARAAGVERVVVPGVDLETSLAAVELAGGYDGIYAAAGFHPHEASRLDDAALAQIEALLALPRVVAVGEIGLDYYYEHSPRDVQRACIAQMLALAEHHVMPVIVHCRDAWEDAAGVLAPWARRVRGAFGERPVGVMHYFSGTLEQARFYVDLGFAISVHTSVTHKKQTLMQEVTSQLPLSALVIETDSPYGAPQAYRGKRNEPAYVIEAAQQIAAEQGVTLEAVAAATSANAARLFRLPVTAGAGGASR